jgi:hypothetical protein
MPINPTTLKAQIDTEITNETVDYSITPAEVGGRMKEIVDYTTEQSALKENLTNKSTNLVTDGASNTKYPSVKAVKDYADGIVVGLLDDRGDYNASSNVFPSTGGSGTSGAIMKGDLWYISVAGTLGGVSVPVGSSVRALVDTPAQTSTNWSILNVGIGFTPENVLNKSTDVITDGASDTKYPSVKAVKTYVDANAGVSVVKVRKTTISSAQVLNIFSTPVEIVPAVAGKIIVPTNIVIIINFNTTQYSDVGGAWRVRFGSTSTSIATITSYLGSASYNQQVLQTLFYSAFTTSGSFDNSPILLTTTGNNPIGGNSGISVYVTYTEITI